MFVCVYVCVCVCGRCRQKISSNSFPLSLLLPGCAAPLYVSLRSDVVLTTKPGDPRQPYYGKEPGAKVCCGGCGIAIVGVYRDKSRYLAFAATYRDKSRFFVVFRVRM